MGKGKENILPLVLAPVSGVKMDLWIKPDKFNQNEICKKQAKAKSAVGSLVLVRRLNLAMDKEDLLMREDLLG